MARCWSGLLTLWLSLLQVVTAIDVDWNSTDSIKAAALTTAETLLTYYHGTEPGQIPGLLPAPYYWWEAGAMFGSLINYWHTTNDSQFNSIISQALQFQVGAHDDYMPSNESASLGNDDQAFWAMAALAAAEYNFPNPTDPTAPSWLGLAQAVFNEQIGRWDTSTCGGGIRWQIYMITGYDTKTSIANGCLFNIAARLARYTGDDLYAQWAAKIWDWMWTIGLINPQYGVFDNSEATLLNCTQLDRSQWAYNAGTMIMGASAMYNYTDGDVLWKNRTENLVNNAKISFFQEQYNGVMTDICEPTTCNTDQKSFKAYLSRWMAAATNMAPFTYDTIYPLLLTSAKAAAAQCTGGTSGVLCGERWYLNGTWDGTDGVGQQMSALEVILGTLITNSTPPLTNTTGGTSTSDPSAGYNGTETLPGTPLPADKRDKIGAWCLTAVMIVIVLAMWWFMASEGLESRGAPPTIGGRLPRESRIWKGGILPAVSTREEMQSQTSVVGRSRASTMPRNKSAMSLDAQSRMMPIDSVLSLSTMTVGEDHLGRSVPDRKQTPVYKGGDLLT